MAVPVNSATSGVGYGVQNGVRFCAHRHARGHRNSPPDCCYPGGLPCSSLSIIVEQKKQGKKPCFFIGADYETRPVRFCAHRHARGHRNSPPDCCYPGGLPCSSLSIIVEQKKQGKKPCFFIGADYETRPVRFCAHRHARGHRNSPPDCCYPGGLPCSSLAQRYYEQKSTRRNALCFLLERITRLELATSTLARWRSTR